MKSSNGPLSRSRPRAETMPAVTVVPMPNGSPIARTWSPSLSLSESAPSDGWQRLVGLDLEHGEIVLGVAGDQPGSKFGAVIECHLDRQSPVDDVIVGDDRTVGVNDEA